MLVAAIERATDEGQMRINLTEIARKNDLRGAGLTAEAWENLQWGTHEECTDPYGSHSVHFEFSQKGFAEARKVVKRVNRRTFLDFLYSLPWTAFWAFVAAIAALIASAPVITGWFK